MLTRPTWSSGEFEPRPQEKLWLDRNECRNTNTIKLVRDITSQCIDESISTYNDLNILYSNAEEVLGISEDNLYFTNGADGAIRTFFELCNFKGVNQHCILMRPTYGMCGVYAHCYCDEVIYLDYERFANRDSNQIKYIREILSNCAGNSIFILANPESPMGICYTKGDIDEIVSICKDRKISLLIDCTYEDFASFKIDLDSESLLNDDIFVAKSFSKSWGLSGVRLGYLHGSTKEIRDAKLARPMYELGTLQALVLKKALDHKCHFEKYVQETIKTRDSFVEQLNAIGIRSHTTHCNFIHVESSTITKKQKIWLDANICYKEFIHRSLRPFTRITVPSDVEKIKIVEALTALR